MPDVLMHQLMSFAFLLALMPILYIYGAVCLMVIARKTGTEAGWMAWIPVLNLLLLCKIAHRSPMWIPLLLIPVVNLVCGIIIMMDVARLRGKPTSLAFLLLVPIVGLIVPMLLAMGPATRDQRSASFTASSAAQARSFPAPPIRAWAAVALDAETGKVLAAANPHGHLAIASTTKVMTAAVLNSNSGT